MKEKYYSNSMDAVTHIRGATKIFAPNSEYMKNILSTAFQKYGLDKNPW